MRLRVLVLLLPLALFGPGGAASGESVAAPPRRIRGATIAPAELGYARTIQECLHEIERKARENVQLEMFFAGVKGDESDLVDQYEKGELDFLLLTLPGPGVEKLFPEMVAVAIPWLYKDRDHLDRAKRKLIPWVERWSGTRGIAVLAWADMGFVSIFSRYPLRQAEDIARMRMWVYPGDILGPLAIVRLGAEPVALPVDQALAGLRDAKIDIAYAPPLLGAALGWHQESTYLVPLNFIYTASILLIRSRTLGSFHPDTQAAVRAATERYELALTERVWKDNLTATNLLVKKGMVLQEPDAETLNGWRRMYGAFGEAFVGRLYSAEVWRQVNKIVADTR